MVFNGERGVPVRTAAETHLHVFRELLRGRFHARNEARGSLNDPFDQSCLSNWSICSPLGGIIVDYSTSRSGVVSHIGHGNSTMNYCTWARVTCSLLCYFFCGYAACPTLCVARKASHCLKCCRGLRSREVNSMQYSRTCSLGSDGTPTVSCRCIQRRRVAHIPGARNRPRCKNWSGILRDHL